MAKNPELFDYNHEEAVFKTKNNEIKLQSLY